jgi:hypothetical protein
LIITYTSLTNAAFVDDDMNLPSGDGTPSGDDGDDLSSSSSGGGGGSSSGDLVCSDGFFFDNVVTNSCTPSCEEFLPAPDHIIIIETICICIAVITAVWAMILTLTVQRTAL